MIVGSRAEPNAGAGRRAPDSSCLVLGPVDGRRRARRGLAGGGVAAGEGRERAQEHIARLGRALRHHHDDRRQLVHQVKVEREQQEEQEERVELERDQVEHDVHDRPDHERRVGQL